MATSERFDTAPGDEHRSSQRAIAIVRILADRHPNMRVSEDNFFKRSDSRSKLTSGQPSDNVFRATAQPPCSKSLSCLAIDYQLSTINYQLFKQHGILESSIGAC